MSLRKLALDVYRGKAVTYNEVSGEEAIRNAIVKACGGEFNIYTFNQNKYNVFQILSEVLVLPTQEDLGVMFGGIVSVEHVGLGDTKEWKIKEPQSFKVATVAAGTQDVRRQKVAGKKAISVEVDYVAVKIYTELEDFITGEVDFVQMVNDVNKSFELDTAKEINKVFVESISDLDASLQVNGTVTEEKLLELVSKVEGKTQLDCEIFGTKLALSKIAGASTMVTEGQKEKYAELAHFGKFFSTDLVEMKQIYDENGKGLLDDNKLYILPKGVDLIKVLYEGDPLVIEGDGTNRNDLQIEFFMRLKRGVAMLVPNYYGVYNIA